MNFGLPEPLYTSGEHDELGSGVTDCLLEPAEPTAASRSVPTTATRDATSRRFVTPTSSFGSLELRSKSICWRERAFKSEREMDRPPLRRLANKERRRASEHNHARAPGGETAPSRRGAARGGGRDRRAAARQRVACPARQARRDPARPRRP